MRKRFARQVRPSGALGLAVISGGGAPDMFVGRFPALHAISLGLPTFGLPREVLIWRVRNLPNLLRGAWRLAVAAVLRIPVLTGGVYLRVQRRDGTWLNYGTASLRVVTTVGVGAVVDAFQNIVELETFKYHGLGTGTNAEAVGDTALQTELTTQYETDNVRPTGSQEEGASANVYKTIGTITVDAGVAATEHGIFTQAATGGGTLLDRTVFTVVNLASSDSLQATYELTVPAGS